MHNREKRTRGKLFYVMPSTKYGNIKYKPRIMYVRDQFLNDLNWADDVLLNF